MKQLLLTAVAAFLTTSSVWAQRPSGYLTDEISAPTSNAASRSAAIYDMQGRQLNAKPDKEVYIQSGQKFIGK